MHPEGPRRSRETVPSPRGSGALEVGARGITTEDVQKRLNKICSWMTPKKDKSQPQPPKSQRTELGPKRKATNLALVLGEKAVLGSYLIWQKRREEWNASEVWPSLSPKPLAERGLHELDRTRQAQERERAAAAGSLCADLALDHDDATQAEVEANANELWRAGLLGVRESAERDPEALCIYTDGSFHGGFAGWGWVAVQNGRRIASSSGPVITDPHDARWVGCQFHSNNSGEMSAVIHASKWLSSRPLGERTVIIPDSWWAIRAAKGSSPRFHRTAAHKAANLAEQYFVEFGWVKGHSQHIGNNKADELANTGRLQATFEARDPPPQLRNRRDDRNVQRRP